jgi:CRISPR-associated endonuclease Csn1
MKSVLGIDLGPNSLGWALLNVGEKEGKIVAAGVRIFEAGLAEMEKDGKGISRNAQRREARSLRRMTERRARRLHKLLHAIQRYGLLPEGSLERPDDRHAFINRLDKELDSPYKLRAKALDSPLKSHELGRALYHLGQRRGFLSNRKTVPKKDEDAGKVKTAIVGLAVKMQASGARTIGEYFSRINPHEERIRTHYTSREMYRDEFEKIWKAQKTHHSAIMTEQAKKEIWLAIFRQRPLKNQKDLIGECELEDGKKRAPWAIVPAQRFRYLQTVNNLQIIDDDAPGGRPLTLEERTKLIEELENRGDLRFPKVRQILELPRTSKFNLERGGEEKLQGNRTATKLIKVFGEKWADMTEPERDDVVEDLRSIVKETTLKKRGLNHWHLDEEGAEELSRIRLEDGYCAFSRQAIDKLLPHLMAGKHVPTAIKELYPGRSERKAIPMDELPPIKSEEVGEIRNPIVERSLTELRKVVNALIKSHGKPDIIRIEMARDLRQPAKQREAAWKRMRTNEKAREKAAKQIIEEVHIREPKRSDILKVQLAEECRWKCPYTGKIISMQSLFGDHPQFDIEHIIPFDRSLDDSYMNKTLCYAEENRKVKHSKSPYEAYHGTVKWGEIIERVKSFAGDARDEKLRRFHFTESELEQFTQNFTSRQLNDTRYATRLAKRYLGFMYGGVNDDGVDGENKRRIFASTGQVTAHLRTAWGLNSILSAGEFKTRDDHRHHAVDAVVIGLTDIAMVKRLSDASKRATGWRPFGSVTPPWGTLRSDVESAIKKVVVSRRVRKRVRGALHEETFYTKPIIGSGGKEYVRVRKALADMSMSDIENIIDPAIKQVVSERLAELGNDIKKFKEPANLPVIVTPSGERHIIKKARFKRNLATFTVGTGPQARYVQSDSNHHMEIVETADGRWEGHVVSLYEAYKRLREGQPIIKKDHGPDKTYKYSICNGDMVELGNDDNRDLFVVRKMNKGNQQVFYAQINDARKRKGISMAGLSAVPNMLRAKQCKKVIISPIGDVQDAND